MTCPSHSELEELCRKIRTELDQKLAAAEEKQKSRDPNILSAIRTLVADIRDYASGKRLDFPTEAIVGVMGAWLRPRLVLVLGSVIATAIAAGEFWLIYRQNEIIERQTQILGDQNRLVEQQARLSRAQAASALLPILQADQAKLPAQSEFALAAYGDVLIDVLLPVIRLGLPKPRESFPSYVPPARNLWLNAVDIVIARKELLSLQDQVSLLFTLLDALNASTTLVINRNWNESFYGQGIVEIDKDQNIALYGRIADQLGLFLMDLDIELSDSEWRRALEAVARMFIFAHDYRFDEYALSWTEQGSGVLGTGIRHRICPKLWERSNDPEQIVDSIYLLLDEALPKGKDKLSKEDTERTIHAIVLYGCAPHLLHNTIPQDADIMTLARSALPFIKHDGMMPTD